MKKFRLFCLPHAGGNKYSYKKFEEYASPYLEVVLMEYPGRGERIKESPQTDAHGLADLLVNEIQHQMDIPYAIYGHSMGTLIGLLITRKLRIRNMILPRFLFFTGSEGPSTRVHPKQRHLLSKADLIEALRTMGGLSEEVLSYPDIFDFFEPIIRADFQAIENFKYSPDMPLAVPITIIIGTKEDVTIEEARSWQLETSHPLEVMQLSGHHFFIFSHTERIMRLVNEKIHEQISNS